MADMFNTFRDPVYWDWYRDVNGNKTSVLRTNETHVVVNNYIVLMEIPDEYYKVQIEGMSEIPWDKPITNPNQFKVFYTIGWIEFHPSMEGKNVLIKQYYSKGICYIPASRIYTELDNNGNITETMQKYVDSLKAFQYKGIYSDEETYYINHQVYYNGSTYICLRNGAKGDNPTDTNTWRVIAGGLNRKGNFNDTIQYNERDIVWYEENHTLYLCKNKPPIGTLPTDENYWDELLTLNDVVSLINDKIDEIENRMSTIENDYSTKKEQWDTDINNKINEAEHKVDEINDKILDIETIMTNIETEYENNLKPDILQATQNANDKAQLAQISADQVDVVINQYEENVKQNIKILKPYVETYAELLSTYPNPENGWTVKVAEEGKVYRWNEIEWVAIDIDTGDVELADLKADVGNKNNLTTENKNSLVDAINEVNNKPSFDGDYENLTNKPFIPTKTSELENDADFETVSESQEKADEAEQNAKTYTDQQITLVTEALSDIETNVGNVETEFAAHKVQNEKRNPVISIEEFASSRVAIAEGWDYTQPFKDAFLEIKNTGKTLILNEEQIYYVSEEIQDTINNFKMIGKNTIIKSLTPAGQACFNITGSLGDELPILEDIPSKSKTIKIPPADSETLDVGDYLKISTTENYFEVANRDYKKGEIVRVESVDKATGIVTISGNGVTLSYTALNNNLRCQKMNLIENVSIEGVEFIGSGTDNGQVGIRIGIAKNVKISKNSFSHFEVGIALKSVISANITQNYISECFKAGTGYGIAVTGASKHINVYNNQFEHNRHSFTAAGEDGVCMHLSVKDNQARFDTDSSFNTHGNARFVDFDGNNVNGSKMGVSVYSPHTRVKNNTIENVKSSAIYTTEGGGINFEAFKNEITNCSDDYFSAIEVYVTATVHEQNLFVKIDNNNINNVSNGAGIRINANNPLRVSANENDLFNIGYTAILIESGEHISSDNNKILKSIRSNVFAIDITGTPSAEVSDISSIYGTTVSIKGNQVGRFAYGIKVDTTDKLILVANILNVANAYKYQLTNVEAVLGGEVLQSPDGSLKRLSVDNAGAITGVNV